MWNLLHLNLGESITSTGTPVTSLLAAAVPWTITMVLTGTVISFVVGVAAGVMAALLRDHWTGQAINLLSSLLHGIPQFLLAVLLALLFTTIWPIFPFGSPYSINLTPGFNLPFIGSLAWHGVLPVATYAISGYGGWALTMKSSVVSVLGDDFIIAARLRGISPSIRWRYVARNAILPLFTGLTMALGFMFGGAVFVEDVFDYPGLGHLLLTAVGNLDYPTMDGAFALITAAVILANIVADLLYSVIDPRIRRGA
jgi:peptide/nickel transport system permease protein